MHDDAIAWADERVRDVRKQMVPVREAFVCAAGIRAREWVSDFFRSTVLQQNERASALGADGLSAMKREATELEASMPDRVRAALNDPELWSDLMQLGETLPRYTVSAGRIDPSLESALRAPISEIGPILLRHGFDAQRLELAINRWSATSIFSPSDEMVQLVGKYAALSQELFEAADGVSTAQEAKRKAEVAELWDQA